MWLCEPFKSTSMMLGDLNVSIPGLYQLKKEDIEKVFAKEVCQEREISVSWILLIKLAYLAIGFPTFTFFFCLMMWFTIEKINSWGLWPILRLSYLKRRLFSDCKNKAERWALKFCHMVQHMYSCYTRLEWIAT